MSIKNRFLIFDQMEEEIVACLIEPFSYCLDQSSVTDDATDDERQAVPVNPSSNSAQQ